MSKPLLLILFALLSVLQMLSERGKECIEEKLWGEKDNDDDPDGDEPNRKKGKK